MKIIILIFFLFSLFFALETRAQVKDDYLYYSVIEGDTLSSRILKGNRRLLNIHFPDSIAGTKLNIWHSNYKDSTFTIAKYDGTYIEVTVEAGATEILKPWEVSALEAYIKLDFQTTQTDTISNGKCGYGSY